MMRAFLCLTRRPYALRKKMVDRIGIGSCPHAYSNQQNRQQRASSTRTGFLSKSIGILRNIFSGDDRTNPKKLLERRYIYFALLAVRLRTLRLAAYNCQIKPDSISSDGMDGPDILESVYEQAVDELDALHLDGMSNVRLREELQSALSPQVIEIFRAFQEVDECLHLSSLRDHSDGTQEPRTDAEIFSEVDWAPFQQILEDEFATVESDIETIRESSTNDSTAQQNALAFQERKLGALECLLTFHQTGRMFNENDYEDLDDFGVDIRNTSDATLSVIRQYQTINLARSALIRDRLGYSILSLKSIIPGAGRGTFLDGKALAGSIVAFQPGDIWPKEHLLTNSPEVMEHFKDDDEDCQISLRFDDYVVDSRYAPVTVLARTGTMNPWALGHMVNHPPAKVLPNCQSTMINYTKRMQLGNLSQYVPNSYARQPGWKSRFFYLEPILMHGLCLLSRRDINCEELVYDYRLQSEETPDWYSVVDYGGDRTMKEEQVVFFRDDWYEK